MSCANVAVATRIDEVMASSGVVSLDDPNRQPPYSSGEICGAVDGAERPDNCEFDAALFARLEFIGTPARVRAPAFGVVRRSADGWESVTFHT